jgi:DNA-binding transcriptional LysR family regulator
MKEKRASTVSIGITDNFARRFPRRFFSDFLEAHPGVELSIESFPHGTCEDHVRDQKRHIGFTVFPSDSERFNSYRLRRDRMKICVAEKHPLAGRKKARMEEFRGESYIALTCGGRENGEVKELCDKNGLFLGVQLSYFDPGLMAELCESGRYICFFAGRLPQSKNLRSIEIEDAGIYSEIHLIVNKRVFINNAVETFIDWTRERFAAGKAINN